MSNKKPAFLFYPGDWLRDPGVRILSPREKGVYIELLIYLFDSGGYVSKSEKDLMHALNFRVEDGEESKSVDDTFHGVIERLLEAKVIRRTDDGRLYNSRILRDMEEKNDISQKRSEAGKAGNQKRWGENRTCDDLRSQTNRKNIANESQTSETCDGEKIANDRYSFSSSVSNNINTLSNAHARENHLPTSETEAVEMCAGIGVPDDFITSKAYPRAVAVGFVDRGSRIVNWPQWVKNYWCTSDNSRRREQSRPQARVEEPREVIHLRQLN